jgi:hypothetical protein
MRATVADLAGRWRACRAAGVPEFSPQDLRHRRPTLWHLEGRPVAEAATQLGQLVPGAPQIPTRTTLSDGARSTRRRCSTKQVAGYGRVFRPSKSIEASSATPNAELRPDPDFPLLWLTFPHRSQAVSEPTTSVVVSQRCPPRRTQTIRRIFISSIMRPARAGSNRVLVFRLET